MSGPGHRPVPSDGMACLVIKALLGRMPPCTNDSRHSPAHYDPPSAAEIITCHSMQWHAGSLHFSQKVTCFDNVLCPSSHLQNAELIRPAILAAMGAASICLVQCLRPIGPSPYHVAAVKIIWSVLQDEHAASEAVSFLSGAGLLFLHVGYLLAMP